MFFLVVYSASKNINNQIMCFSIRFKIFLKWKINITNMFDMIIIASYTGISWRIFKKKSYFLELHIFSSLNKYCYCLCKCWRKVCSIFFFIKLTLNRNSMAALSVFLLIYQTIQKMHSFVSFKNVILQINNKILITNNSSRSFIISCILFIILYQILFNLENFEPV